MYVFRATRFRVKVVGLRHFYLHLIFRSMVSFGLPNSLRFSRLQRGTTISNVFPARFTFPLGGSMRDLLIRFVSGLGFFFMLHLRREQRRHLMAVSPVNVGNFHRFLTRRRRLFNRYQLSVR